MRPNGPLGDRRIDPPAAVELGFCSECMGECYQSDAFPDIDSFQCEFCGRSVCEDCADTEHYNRACSVCACTEEAGETAARTGNKEDLSLYLAMRRIRDEPIPAKLAEDVGLADSIPLDAFNYAQVLEKDNGKDSN